ncbi:MAG: hypothetical protein WA957_15360, partial [Alteraurantiacibacter sp.]
MSLEPEYAAGSGSENYKPHEYAPTHDLATHHLSTLTRKVRQPCELEAIKDIDVIKILPSACRSCELITGASWVRIGHFIESPDFRSVGIPAIRPPRSIRHFGLEADRRRGLVVWWGVGEVLKTWR